jgi:hypothetical protein
VNHGQLWVRPVSYGGVGQEGYNRGNATAYSLQGRAYYIRSENRETQYRYRDRGQQTTYYYEKWGDWSAWQDGAVSAGGDRQVETRKMYRYREV